MEDLTADQIHVDHNNVSVYHVRQNGTTELPDGHFYFVEHGETFTDINFQNGPVKEHGINGLTNEALLSIVEHRLGILDAKFPCNENKQAIEHTKKALKVLEARTKERMSRGVEGKNLA